MKINNLWLASTAMFFFLTIGTAAAQTVLTGEEASNTLKLEQVNTTPDKVSGVIVNSSPHRVRDVTLLVQYHWLWKNERHPGQDSPGRLDTVRIDKELAPGESLPFSYSPRSPLPQRNDGYFMPEVDVGGFTVIVPQKRSAQR